MNLNYEGINWLAILACVVVGQAFLTIWFVALFAKPWAAEYGATDPKEHAKAVPAFTYGIGALCVFLLALGMAVLQASLGIKTLGAGLMFGLYFALHFSLATALPGYAFLKRYRAFALAMGSQTVLILLLSTLLAVWH
jgi:hypothetical protein